MEFIINLGPAFSESLNVRAGSPPRTRGHQELPEEDQEEPELPTLPPDKDATRHTISLHKKQANSKKIVSLPQLCGTIQHLYSQFLNP